MESRCCITRTGLLTHSRGGEGLLFRCSAFGSDVRLLMVDDIDKDILFAADVACAKRSKILSDPNVKVRGEHAEVRRRTLRQDLRAIFKLIQNRFAHVLIDIDENGAMVNLA